MAKWECIVCGWIYDEVTGDPESGVAPGTKWEDIPEDWLCPDCGVGKDDFEQIDGGPAPQAESEAEESSVKPIVIIGTGLGGYNLVKELRKSDQETPVIMITADDGRSYSKPMLSTGFTRNTDADGLMMADAGKMALQFNVSIWTNTEVTAIDTAKQVVTAAGVEVEYGSLVLAWGADVIRPPIGGDATDSVFSCNDLVDYATFRAELKKRKAKKVVIIGGGLIGCEFTNDLLNGDFDVETVDPLGYCLPTLLPEAAGKAVQAALEEKGAKFHFGPLVTEVNKQGDALGVTLNNGSVLDADIVVSAVGVRPRLALAEQSGIAVNRGIVANRLLETSANNVYTLGDCAEVGGNVLFYVAPLMAGARALAKTLAGTPTEVSYPAMPVTIKTPACPVVVAPAPRDAEGEWTIEQSGNDVVAEFRNPQGELIGFALTGKGTAEKVRLQKELPAIMA
ncbi:rubredoxin-NAD+ reductase [Sinobacterium caligoides]|uniref:Rubredoxin-NAD+ reductase n=1 Tax=Sinobacterium caligoides TaxID=933926 RepID=A0A3N2DH08_9GAMM|nr:FAD-dependent oxidoreductase [Sinobacterium caligoides]ROR99086.1 rubredoxin-NAD+ reductase [Sinobacterium caligoides]